MHQTLSQAAGHCSHCHRGFLPEITYGGQKWNRVQGILLHHANFLFTCELKLFQLIYSECHEDKDSHSMMASMINFILSHKCNKHLKDTTFRRMNEVESMFHTSPEVNLPFTDQIIIICKLFVSELLQVHQK